MERQHFVVLIDPVGRGSKTKHPGAGDESAARDGGGRAPVATSEGRRGTDTSQEVGRGYAGANERDVCGKTGKRGMEGTGRESRDPHPADSYNFNHQLAGYTPASTGTSYM